MTDLIPGFERLSNKVEMLTSQNTSGVVIGQHSAERAQAALEVGKKMGIPVEIVANENDDLTLTNGDKVKVFEGYRGLRIENGTTSLGDFWAEVDKIAIQKN